MIVAYDSDYLVLGTLTSWDDEAKHTWGDEEFLAAERAGMPLRALADVRGARGAKVWIGDLPAVPGQTLPLRAILTGPPGRKRLAALEDTETGRRWENAL